ncbi:Cellulase [Methanocaldococcus infernus ME]|uniref:Cellulase n=1 Tax=Methanocaldococcus infernus (strain DSM 11812 / JCM 15783 / ME) TaxID=573063 RepID=D5VS43_METIM|nr:M42 family metallopeptidase [Methanocaldococcus infernus]ADG13396.1 Cellulase [Methanocaldococcus infernus ME]
MVIEYLKKLSELHGISGREDSVREFMKEELEKYCEVEIDKFGNLIAKKGEGEKSLMLAAHMDEIGLMVKYIDDNGFLKFTKIGGIYDPTILNQKVVVHGRKGDIIGVLGSKPPHRMKEEERNKLIKYEDMFIDIGAESREEAMEMGVRIGTWVSFLTEVHELGKHRLTGKAFDDRVGCSILLDVMRNLPDDLDFKVYAVGTVQEEVGLKGAKVSAFKLNPDMAIALDVTISGDHPGIKKEDAPVELGKGPVVGIVDASGRGLIAHPRVLELIEEVSLKYNIEVQWEVGEGGTTDATAIHLAREGIPTGVISVPARYIHTPVEVIDKRDLKKTSELVLKTILEFPNFF